MGQAGRRPKRRQEIKEPLGKAGIVEANCDSLSGEPGLVAKLSHAGGKE